ncbi:MAG: hypothetical protein WAM66_07820 [Acidobacteriaceae bacterium]
MGGKSMWLTHEEFGPELGFLLRRRKYAEAVYFWKAARPLAQLTVPPSDFLSQVMETDPPCLAFLRPHERDEIQIAAGIACLVGASGKLGRFVSRKLSWTHPLTKDAAVHNLLAAFQNEQLVNRIIAEQLGYRTKVKVQNSCEGACITCLLASSVEFPLEHCPPVPIVGCVNYETGCRCSLAVTYSVPKHDTVSRHL